ncbi:MAG: trigger factor, partial [Clostridiales bacterium]|nr:trigger factor [Clostridiales bacterium]
MAATVEIMETNKVKVTFRVSPDVFEKGIQQAYNKSKGKFNLPGFRKGKAPRKFIEINYGKDVFYQEALNIVLPDAYEAAIKENELATVSRPEIDVQELTAEEGAVITAEVYLRPQITATDYKGLSYKPFDTTVTAEEIEAELTAAQEKNARVISADDRAIQNGDTVDIDFEGFIDEEPFEGGKAQGYELVIGSHSFIDTFEDQLIGKKAGDDCEVNVSFPENYGKEELAGKPALFKVSVNEVKYKELPEINDEFAQDVSEFDTLAEYKEDIKAKIEEKKTEQAKSEKENQVIKAMVEKTPFDLPQPMVETQIDSMVKDFANLLRQRGMDIETYAQYTGMTIADLRKSYAENAELQVRARLCLESIAKLENIEATEEDMNAEIDKMAASYRMDRAKLLEI